MLDKTYMDRDPTNSLIAQNLKSLVEEKKTTVAKLAKDAGMSHTGARDIIEEKVKNPTYNSLLKLAKAAGVDVRRITVGPDYALIDQEDAELADLAHRLSPDLRRKLLGFGEGLLAAVDPSPEGSGEEQQ